MSGEGTRTAREGTESSQTFYSTTTMLVNSFTNSTTSGKIISRLTMMSLEDRHALMEKQIKSFRDKVGQCQCSYSTDLAERIFTAYSRESQQAVTTVLRLKRHLLNVKQMESKPSKATQYGDWYLSNIEYLQELKANFDERIYQPLVSLYGPTSLRAPSTDSTPSVGEKSHTSFDQLRPSTTQSVLKFKNELPEVKDLYDFTEIDNISTRLAYIQQRWQHLLDDEGEINSALFSYTSNAEMSPTCPTELSNILRLVPDILVKCNNAAMLAKQWIATASSKAFDLDAKCSKLERVRSVLSEKLTDLKTRIANEESKLESNSGDLDFLVVKEERANEIMSKLQQAEQRIAVIRQELHRVQETRGQLLQQLADNWDSSYERSEKERSLKSAEVDINRLQHELRLQLYGLDIMNEDLIVELELKPCIIRYTDQLQNSCEELEQDIDEKKQEKQSIELALEPVIADSRQAQVEMSRVNSVVRTPESGGPLHSTTQQQFFIK